MRRRPSAIQWRQNNLRNPLPESFWQRDNQAIGLNQQPASTVKSPERAGAHRGIPEVRFGADWMTVGRGQVE